MKEEQILPLANAAKSNIDILSGSGPPVMHCYIPHGQWAVELLQCTPLPPEGSGQCNFCNTMPHCLGAVGSATPVIDSHTAHWAVGSGVPTMHHRTGRGQWEVELLQCAGPPAGGTGSPAQEAVAA